MPSIRNLVFAVLAVASAVHAQCDDDVTIDSNTEVSKIRSCPTLKGSLTIGKKVTQLVLPDSLTKIDGSFTCDGAAGLTSISADGLASIRDDFTLRSLTVLNTLRMPMLKKVGTISWITLPALKALDFKTQVNQADKVEIADTILTTLNGINLVKTETFNINNNKYLRTVDVALGSVSDALTIAFNGRGVNASFPELKWAQNITIRDAGEIYFPKLERVNNSISFVNNTFEVASFPELTEVGQSFAFVSCIGLTNLTAGMLESVGGTFQLANNTMLKKVEGFGSLTTVGGAIDLSGVFTDVSFPKLDDVRGGFNLQTTEAFNCDPFDKAHADGVIKGNDFTCVGDAEVAESSNGGASTKGKDSGNSDSGAGQVAVNLGLAVFAGAAALLVL